MWSYYSTPPPPPPPPPPPALYTHSAWRLVCSPQGNNCQNWQNIFVFIPYFPHLNRCFTGRQKNHNNEETPNHILWCMKKEDKIAFFNFKNIHFSSNYRLSNASTRCLFTFCGSSLRNRKLIAWMSLLNRRFRI